jgi:hypothetical protein
MCEPIYSIRSRGLCRKATRVHRTSGCMQRWHGADCVGCAALPLFALPGTGSSMKSAGAKGAAGAAALQQQAAAEAAAAAAAALAIPPGQLRVQLSLPADVATRDWLRTGAARATCRTGLVPTPVCPCRHRQCYARSPQASKWPVCRFIAS